MIYELRTYWAAPGKLDRLHARFRDVTLPLFARHAMQVVGFWTPSLADESTGDLVYLLAFPDQGRDLALQPGPAGAMAAWFLLAGLGLVGATVFLM